MTSVSYNIFKEFVKKGRLKKVQVNVVHSYMGGFSTIYHYLNNEGKVMAIEEDGDSGYYQIESKEAENLNTLEFVNNIINERIFKNK